MSHVIQSAIIFPLPLFHCLLLVDIQLFLYVCLEIIILSQKRSREAEKKELRAILEQVVDTHVCIQIFTKKKKKEYTLRSSIYRYTSRLMMPIGKLYMWREAGSSSQPRENTEPYKDFSRILITLLLYVY